MDGVTEIDTENSQISSASFTSITRRTLSTFLTNCGAGSIETGMSYEAKFPDKYSNVCISHVSRPDCISNYFKYSNKVDLHNQARYFYLALEKKWVATNPYFGLYTSESSITLVDV